MSSYRICSGEKARKMWSFGNKAIRTLLYRYYTCTTWFIFLVCSFPSPILAVSPVTHRTSPKPRSVFFIFIDQFVCLCFLFLKFYFIILFVFASYIHPSVQTVLHCLCITHQNLRCVTMLNKLPTCTSWTLILIYAFCFFRFQKFCKAVYQAV